METNWPKMSLRLKIARVLITAMLIGVPVFAQQAASFKDWDFSYESVFERNHVARNDWVWSFLARYRSPAEKWATTWQGKPIVSSILVETYKFYSGKWLTIWLIRTRDEAFYWEALEGREAVNEESYSTSAYDAFYDQVSSWQQFTPKPESELPPGTIPGYLGVLSYYGPKGSRQMLISEEDFFICLDKTCLPGHNKEGRLMKALEPTYEPASAKTYKHKTEAEIARMTPSQRIYEMILEQENHNSINDRQDYLIQKYIRMDGIEGWAHLIEMMETYDPKHLRDLRFYTAARIASDIDERSFRLRGSPEGQKIIDAIERVSARRKAEGERYSYPEGDIRRLKGVSMTDDTIRETLLIKYRIEISDSELLEFSNYLVKFDPAYPLWSKQIYVKIYPPKNSSREPYMTHIMANPNRFHQAYLAFKKQPNHPQSPKSKSATLSSPKP